MAILRLPLKLWDFLVRLDISDRALAYVLIFPSAFLIFLFAIYPALRGLWVSLFRVDAATYEMSFTGLTNYTRLFADERFWESTWLTIWFVAVSNIIQLVLGLAITLLVNQELRGRNFVRGIVLFPYLVPAIVIALTWRYMLDPTLGILNKGMVEVGLLNRPYPFLTRPDSAIGVIIFAGVWKYTPFFVIMLLARLQVIPIAILEAAKLDGANAWNVFRHITLPWLMPVIIIALLLRTIWTFNEFEMVYLFAFGGPRFSTTTLPVLVNFYARDAQLLGMAAATATFMVFVLMIMATAYFYLYDRAEDNLY